MLAGDRVAIKTAFLRSPLASPYATDNSTNERNFVFARIEDLTRSTVRLLSSRLALDRLVRVSGKDQIQRPAFPPIQRFQPVLKIQPIQLLFPERGSCSIASWMALANSSLR